MTHSEQINEIAAALAKAQGVITGAVKDSANPFFKSKYADLASVWDACRKPLSDNGLSVVQSPEANGAVVTLETILLHSSGQWFRNTLTVSAKEDSPQAIGSAITYLRRYVLQSFAGVAPEDDDAEAAHGRAGYSVQPSAAKNVSRHTDEGPTVMDGLTIVRVDTTDTSNKNVRKSLLTLSNRSTFSTINPKLASLAEQLAQEGCPILIEGKSTKWGMELVSLQRAEGDPSTKPREALAEPLEADSIPF
jgi:hypothetical protein